MVGAGSPRGFPTRPRGVATGDTVASEIGQDARRQVAIEKTVAVPARAGLKPAPTESGGGL
jgi:hypothetical protein